MDFRQFDDAREFCALAEELLLRSEAENGLLLGIAERLAEQSGVDWAESCCLPLLCGVEKGGRLIAAAVMTPPHRLIVTPMSAEAAGALARGLHDRQIGVPGVVGPGDAPGRFAEAWSTLIGQPASPGRSLREYWTDRVDLSAASAPGRFQAATMGDSDLVLRWTAAFWCEVGEQTPGQPQTMRRRILQRQVFLWMNPGPVCMANFTGPTPNGIRIGIVYTPPERRRHGYATALTAALTGHLLKCGFRYCILFADLADATSNNIYPKIGYRPLCDYVELNFPRAAWTMVARA